MGFLLKDKDIKSFLQAFAFLMFVMILLSAVVTVIQFAQAEQVSPRTITDVNEDGWSRSDTHPRNNDTTSIHIDWISVGNIKEFGWIEWNTSVIPDTATVHNLFFQYMPANTFTEDIYVRNLTDNQPTTRTATEIFDDIIAANKIVDITEGTLNEVDIITLNPSDLQNRLADDWYAIGLYPCVDSEDDRNIWSSEGTYAPRIIVETDEGNYTLVMNGLYYENGTSAGQTNVTVYYLNGTTTEMSVNGTAYLGATNEIDEISWDAGQDARPIAWYTNETVYLFTPEDTYGVYRFDINDYSGRVGQGECYLESYRAVNGTWRLVERRQFTGIYNDVPMLMVLYKVYKVQIRFSDNSIWDHGYFYPGVDLTPTIAVTSIEFGDQAHTVYQYITAEATRPNATHIQLIYNDTTPGYDTTSANMTVTYRIGTHAYNTTNAGVDAFTFNWYGAENTTDYVVSLYVVHELHSSIQQTWVLDYSRIFESFPNFELFGDMGGLPTTNLLAITVGLVLAGACSFKSAALAPFLFMCIQAIFTYLGGASYTETQLGIGIALSIMLGLAIGDRQV